MTTAREDEGSTIADCPPSDAVEATGEVFRCCKREIPLPADMETHEESGRLPEAVPCLRRALSVFTDRSDAEHQARAFLRFWRRASVTKATLSPEHGVTKLTPGKQPTHTSWWPSKDLTPAARAKLFTSIGRE